jgi:hypothetical protein
MPFCPHAGQAPPFPVDEKEEKILKIPSFRPQASTGPGRIFGLRCFHLPVKWGT